MRDSKGRSKGSRNKGYFYRAGRAWFTKDKAQRFVPLTNKSGARIKGKSADEAAKDAYARYVVSLGDAPKQVVGRGVTLSEVCDYYLARAQQESRASTVEKRANTLFELTQVTLLRAILNFFGVEMIRKFNADGRRIVVRRCSEDLVS